MNNWNLSQIVPVFTIQEFNILLPAFILLLTSIINLLFAAGFREKHFLSAKVCFVVTFLGIAGSLLSIGVMGDDAAGLGNYLILDHGLKGTFALLLLGSLLALGVIYIQDFLSNFVSELYALITFSLLGMFFLVFSNHLMLVFVALELMSLSVYVIVSLRRINAFSAEAGVKYFILGGLSACLILYGIVLLFGATGTFSLTEISSQLIQAGDAKVNLAKLAGVLILSGILFKIGAFPFHSWVPDVYQGSPAAISGWMSSVIKMASFVLLVKVSTSFLLITPLFSFFSPLISLVAVMTMFIGNLLALQQHQMKRLLAYSSVAHSGYLLVALVAGATNPKAFMSLFIYLTTYTILSITTFGVLAIWENQNVKDITIDHLTGIGKILKLPSAFFVLALMGLAGLPFTAGFVGKFLLIFEGISGRQTILCVLLILASLIGAYYYLRVFYLMYLKPSNENTNFINQNSKAIWIPTAFLTVLNVIIGIAPQFFIPWLATKL